MILAVIVLAAAAGYLLYRLISLRRQLRIMTEELVRTREPGYNRQIRVKLGDSAIEKLAAEMNNTVDVQKKLKFDAEASEKLMRKAVSDIAHDLRTPIAVIKGDLQLVMSGGELSGKDRAYIGVCLQKTDLLKQMSDEFFELAVLESNSSQVPLTRIDLTSAVMMFLAENEGRIRLAGIEPEILFPPKTVFINADEQLLGRILGNLLGNVLKYSAGDLKITVGSEEGGSISFENSVAGELPDPELLFDRSYRADSARNGSGAGIGLYIVRLLAEKQGASVSAGLQGNRLCVKIAFSRGDK